MQLWRYINPNPAPAEDPGLEKRTAAPILLAALVFLVLFSLGFGLLFVVLNSTFVQDFVLRRICVVLIVLLAAGALSLVAARLRRAEALRYAVLRDGGGRLYALDYLAPRLRRYALGCGVHEALVPAEAGEHLLSLAPSEAAMEAWVHALDEYGILQRLAGEDGYGGIPRPITAVLGVRPALLGGYTVACCVLTAKGRKASLALYLPGDYDGLKDLLPLLENLGNQQAPST